jgi:serine/threonine protein kinase
MPPAHFGEDKGGAAKSIVVEQQVTDEAKNGIYHLKPTEKIYDFYYWEKVLQEDGDGGKVVVCRAKVGDHGPRKHTRSKTWHNETSGMREDAGIAADPPETLPSVGFDYVMKIRSKELFRHAQQEARYRGTLLRMLNLPTHRGVMRVLNVLEDEDFYYVVTEKASEDSFFGSLLHEFRDGVMPVDAVQATLRQILEALGHVHQQGMLHRDIKPDNLVMQVNVDPDSHRVISRHVVLIDFDHADPEWQGSVGPAKDQLFGTLRFNAPETFLGRYSQESDLYSVGAILYLLMAGGMPYKDELFEQGIAEQPTRESCCAFYRRLGRTSVSWEGAAWSAQPTCLDLCQRLLAFEPQDRPRSAEEALAHAFFNPPD